MRTIDAAAAKALAHAPAEIAFLDVREHGPYGEGHPFLAVWCPYSRLEVAAPSLVPNLRVPVILIDGGDGIAEKAASRLEQLGYQAVMVVAGGVRAWAAAGYTLFEGEHVPSKTLGELAEHRFHPDTVDPQTLAAWQSEHRSHCLFDVRPPAEHRKMTVPGARCLPNGELPHRLPAAVPDRTVPIVLTCAGRTRSLIGAVSLKLLGIENPVYGLQNGTQGWTLAGLDLDRGREPEAFPAPSPSDLDASRELARDFARRTGLRFIRADALDALSADRSRTLYVLDVRSAEEFAVGHLEGASHAPCVQIVQATDRWLGVRRARIVLADDTGLRAAIAAYWLMQMGYETYVLPDADDPASHRGRQSSRSLPDPATPTLRRVAPADAASAAACGDAVVLDLRSSVEYRREHAAGSRWAIRPALAGALGDWRGRIDLIADDERLAGLAATDLRETGHGDVRIVIGGLDAWKSAGLPTEAGWREPSSRPVDFLAFVHDRHDGNLDAARQYLAWETGLVGRLDPQERATLHL